MKIKKIAILGLSMLSFGLALTSCNLTNDDEGVQSLPPISDTTITPPDNNQDSNTEKVTLTVMTGSSSKKYEFLKGENIKLSSLTGLKKSDYDIEGFYYDILNTEKVDNEIELTGDLKIYVKYTLKQSDTDITTPTNGGNDTPSTPSVEDLQTVDYTFFNYTETKENNKTIISKNEIVVSDQIAKTDTPKTYEEFYNENKATINEQLNLTSSNFANTTDVVYNSTNDNTASIVSSLIYNENNKDTYYLTNIVDETGYIRYTFEFPYKDKTGKDTFTVYGKNLTDAQTQPFDETGNVNFFTLLAQNDKYKTDQVAILQLSGFNKITCDYQKNDETVSNSIFVLANEEYKIPYTLTSIRAKAENEIINEDKIFFSMTNESKYGYSSPYLEDIHNELSSNASDAKNAVGVVFTLSDSTGKYRSLRLFYSFEIDQTRIYAETDDWQFVEIYNDGCSTIKTENDDILPEDEFVKLISNYDTISGWQTVESSQPYFLNSFSYFVNPSSPNSVELTYGFICSADYFSISCSLDVREKIGDIIEKTFVQGIKVIDNKLFY